MAPCAVKQIGEEAYPSGLVVIAVNIDVRLPARRFAGTGIKNRVRGGVFTRHGRSSTAGKRPLQAPSTLVRHERASHLFLFTWDLAARKRVISLQFGNILNVGAERSCFPGTY